MWLQEKCSFLPKEKIFSTRCLDRYTNIKDRKSKGRSAHPWSIYSWLFKLCQWTEIRGLVDWRTVIVSEEENKWSARAASQTMFSFIDHFLIQTEASLQAFLIRHPLTSPLKSPWPPIIIITVLTKVWKFPQPAHNISESEIRPDVQTVWSPLIGNC